MKGGGLRTSHWLTIPLDITLHSMGTYAIDGEYGVERWERMFGTQLYWLDWINRQMLEYDIFERAGVTRPAGIINKYPEN